MFNSAFFPFTLLHFAKILEVFGVSVAFLAISAKVAMLQGVQILAVFGLFIGRFVNFLEDIRGSWAVF